MYSKRLTSEEASEGFVLVLKNQLSYFPQVGKSFLLVRDGHSRKARVESYPCTCRGPDEPHKHFFIRSGDSGWGTRWLFEETRVRRLAVFSWSIEGILSNWAF